MLGLCHAERLVCALALLLGRVGKTQEDLPRTTKYTGGRSTALQAVLRIGMADRIPLGMVLGVHPLLCGREQDFRFSGRSTTEALRASLEGTGYVLSSVDGVYRIVAPDPSPGERKTSAYAFPTFPSTLDTMSGVGALLTGWIVDVIEGAGGFLVDHLSSGDDEQLRLPKLKSVTPPQVADAVVKMKGKGFWVMQAHSLSSPPKPGSTQISIFSYHDLAGRDPAVSCAEATPD